MVTTAEFVKAIRKALGITQYQMGLILSKDRSTIAKYETGVADPPGSVIMRLMELKKRRGKKNGKKKPVKNTKSGA